MGCILFKHQVQQVHYNSGGKRTQPGHRRFSVKQRVTETSLFIFLFSFANRTLTLKETTNNTTTITKKRNNKQYNQALLARQA
jgi:hypothetical protein